MRILKVLALVTVTSLAVVGAPAAVGGQDGTATISGTAYTFNTRNVIAGATITVEELPGVSTTTAADGTYALEVPVGSVVTLAIEAAGHGGIHLQTFTLDDEHHGTAVVGANFQTPTTAVYDALRALIAGYIGRDPFEDGCVVVTTVGMEELAGMPFEEFIRFAPHGVAGATATITPTVAEPIYFNASVVPDPAQLTTSIDGGVLWPNVPPGEYVLSASHPTVTFTTADVRCEQGWVVNANPVWGLYALDSGTTTPTTSSTSTTTSTTTTTPAAAGTTTPADPGGDDGADPGSETLARTGPATGTFVVAAVGLLGLGALLVAVDRRLRRPA